MTTNLGVRTGLSPSNFYQNLYPNLCNAWVGETNHGVDTRPPYPPPRLPFQNLDPPDKKITLRTAHIG